MGQFNTIPPNPFPPSSEKMGDAVEIERDIASIKDDITSIENDVNDLNGNKANQITIAPFFSAETSYTAGDIVNYNGLTYRCVNDHEGAWDADDFAPTTISNELDSLKSGLSTVENTLDTKVTFTSVGGTDANYRDVTIPSDKNAVFLIVAGGSITSVSTDSIGNVSDIAFASISGDSQKIDDHTVRIWGGSWYRSYSVLKLA